MTTTIRKWSAKAHWDRWTAVCAAALLTAGIPASAQETFGTLQFTGDDGALSFPTCASGQTVAWDPSDPAVYPVPLDADGDGIYQFTTVDVPAGCTVKLTVQKLGPKPVVWLASGAVTISGTLDLSGANGHAATLGASRAPSTPGPGGFAGGMGSIAGVGSPTPGFGPGATQGGYRPGGAGYQNVGDSPYQGGAGGASYGNRFLLPLIGGSGAGGNNGGGGAGGGAILITSASSIAIGGSIKANGGGYGTGGNGGGGSGGAIHLVAPAISGAGSLRVDGGVGDYSAHGSVGRIRLESSDTTGFTGSATQNSDPIVVTLVPTSRIFSANAPFPILRIRSVGGQAVPEPPTGGFATADVTINSPDPVPIEIEGQDVPDTATLTIEVHSEGGGSTTIPDSPQMVGGLATTSWTFDPGFSTITVRASWPPQ